MFELNKAAHFQHVHVGLPLYVYWLIRIRITTNWLCGDPTAQRILLHHICIMSENKDPGLGWEILTLLMLVWLLHPLPHHRDDLFTPKAAIAHIDTKLRVTFAH